MQTALRPNAQRAKIAIIMIWITLGTQIVSSISDFFQLMLLKAIDNGESYGIDSLNANDTRQQILGIVTFLMLIASAVTYIQWFRRAYYNLHLMDGNLRFSEGWASGAWFVPIISLFRPFQIMSELFQVSKAILSRNLPQWQAREHSTLLGIWWALWVINNVWGNISARVTLDASTIEKLIVSTQISMWNVVINIPLAILAVRIIQEYSGMEGLLATPMAVFQQDEPVSAAPMEEPAAPSINLEKGPSAE
ncbi:MAG: DUF4328 domain-containing protein [Bacteroidetes bacterium]|nr:DUF4328 domain-containing protein [Bacteroidota bacterium]